MIRIMCIMILLFPAAFSKAQTWDEWFNQNKTQKSYLVQQIAALKVYIGYAQKGYSIAQAGLTAIGDLKNGDLNLHTGYFNSLKAINPKLKNYARIADIIALQLKMVQIYKSTLQRARQSGQYKTAEMDYIYRVFIKLLEAANANIDELINVTTAGKLEMKDDERISRINGIYNDMQDKYSFAMHFSTETQTLYLQRTRDQHDIQSGKMLYDLKK